MKTDRQADNMTQLTQDRSIELDRTAASRTSGYEQYFCEHCPPNLPIVGRSEGMTECLRTIKLVAQSNCNPVLILGETGTGKELAAQAIHEWRHPGATFVAVNCAALTAGLLESELFGHVKGSFTGADRDKVGLFELASDGTIFLDEISEMPLELQAKLLRVLQERIFRRVGGTKDLHCNATIVASSNRDLAAEAKEGTFRKDLFYRLAVFPVKIPSLNSQRRRADIPLLAKYFVETSNITSRDDLMGLSESALDELTQHHWPGNVRELRNVVERAMIVEQTTEVTPASLIIHHEDDDDLVDDRPRTSPEDFSLETAEREFIIRALKETGYQRTRAADLLGISRGTLQTKLKRYEIDVPASPNARTSRKSA
ncbi:MAG: sigma-54 interaction domain-containing protein [Planctomycetota bacterium]